ncbi:hypothetical protein [Gallaecimonas sp. GXIMD4217]|uniref:hypothetical protein n=1 Tax=Gallaecimonas sp. GXIMD4217 TaxID=3131927 RepID=UPI00311B1D29
MEHFQEVVRIIGLVLVILGWLLKSRHTMLIGALLIYGADVAAGMAGNFVGDVQGTVPKS